MQVAHVLLFRGIPVHYSYQIPEDDTFSVGDHVVVPVGHSTASGVIMDVLTQNDETSTRLKYIHEKDPKLPPLLPETIHLINWFQHHYHCTPYKAYQTIVGKRKFRELPEFEPPSTTESAHELTDEQDLALTTMLQAKGHQSFLLKGVTSSGKTEVYMQLAQALLKQGKQCIILIPEIALTPQFSTAFRERFNDDIAILHSGLTPKQKEIEWNKIYQEQAPLVIGPRSAIFAPFRNIGAIIIDEEHEPTYKQDTHPRYYTHTVAEYRAAYHNAIVVYGSATPSLDTYANPRIQPLTLSKRIHNRPLPQVTLIDQKVMIEDSDDYLLSSALLEQITETLNNKQKVMILINRRGFSTYISCHKCGRVHSCNSCGLSYTYHKDKTLRCHRCHLIAPLTHTCSHCKKNTLQYGGIGIQKVEIELKKHFSDATIIRLDKDSGSTHKKMHALLDRFKQEGDILIGTQLIAKGHHIDSVTLVGVLGIDTTLNIPDFRAPERAFQLLTQVAGRAGRGDRVGQVIVQTIQPEHYAIHHASTHDVDGFLTQELQYRNALHYPPFSKMVHIVISSRYERAVQTTAKEIGAHINRKLGTDTAIHVFGPQPAPIEKLKDYFRWSILLKFDDPHSDIIHETLSSLPQHPRAVRVIIDIDPRHIL